MCIYTAWALLSKFFQSPLFQVKHFPIQTYFWNCTQCSKASTWMLLLHKKMYWTLWLVDCAFRFAVAWTLKFHRLHSRLHFCEWCMCPCMWSLCRRVTATSGSRLPIGLGNDNDKFSQLVSPTGQVNLSSHTVRPRTLIGQDHQV